MDTEVDNEPPHVSKELISYLERVIPPCDPKVGDTIEELMHHGGRRSVVHFLKRLNEKGN